MKTLVVEKDCSMHLQEVNVPKVNEWQALVKVIANGMCGTDVKICHHAFKGVGINQYPLMQGHEGVGEIVEVGSKVKNLKVGDWVTLPFVNADESLNPGLGSGWGACSEYGIVWDKDAPMGPPEKYAQCIIPKELDPVDAIMIITFREVYSTIKFFGVKPEDTILVMGCGPVGLTYIKLMHLMGIKNIMACDIVPEKLEQAKKNGAAIVFDSSKCDLSEEVHKVYPEGLDYVLDAIGKIDVPTMAMPLIKDRGAVLCYGVPAEQTVTIDFSKADYNWRVVYQQMPRKDEEGAAHEQIVNWMLDGTLNPKEFISDYFPMKDAVKAYELMLDRKLMKKGVIIIDEKYNK